jgi:hypothetical protein
VSPGVPGQDLGHRGTRILPEQIEHEPSRRSACRILLIGVTGSYFQRGHWSPPSGTSTPEALSTCISQSSTHSKELAIIPRPSRSCLQPHRTSPLTPILGDPAPASRSDRFETTRRKMFTSTTVVDHRWDSALNANSVIRASRVDLSNHLALTESGLDHVG